MRFWEIAFLVALAFCIFGFARNIKFLYITHSKKQYLKNLSVVISIWILLFAILVVANYLTGFNPFLIDQRVLIPILIVPVVLVLVIKSNIDPGWASLERGKALWQSLAPSLKYKDGRISNEASLYANHSSIIKAKTLLQRSIECAPSSHSDPLYSKANEGLALQELGLLHRVINEFDDAEKSYLRSMDVLEGAGGMKSTSKPVLSAYRETLFRLGELNHVNGNNDRAREFYNKALFLDEKLGHDDPVAEEWIRQLLSELG
jgi:tetratricopeptide (TPR) repeat protein